MTAQMNEAVRPLTNDEKKAAEAAFRAAPFNPQWSEAARKVYQGIAGAMATNPNHGLGGLAEVLRESTGSDPSREGKSRSRLKTKTP